MPMRNYESIATRLRNSSPLEERMSDAMMWDELAALQTNVWLRSIDGPFAARLTLDRIRGRHMQHVRR